MEVREAEAAVASQVVIGFAIDEVMLWHYGAVDVAVAVGVLEDCIVVGSSGLVVAAAVGGVGLSQKTSYGNVGAEARSMMVVVVC